MDKSNIIVFDIEADNLYLQSKQVWYMRWKTADGSKTLNLRPFQMTKEEVRQAVVDFLSQFDKPFIVGHNILGYDVWVLWKHFDLQPRVGKKGKDTLAGVEVVFWDTLYLSMYLEPDLESHSLDALSRKAGSYKVDYRQSLVDIGAMQGDEPKGHEFSFYHPLMEDYCNQDVDGNIVVFFDLWRKAIDMYGDAWVHQSYRMGQKSFFLMRAQEFTGHAFNKELALEVKERLEKEIEDLKNKVEPRLPARKPNKGEEKEYTLPKNPYKKDGSYSVHMLNFIAKHNGVQKSQGVVEFYGKDYKVVGGLVLDVKLPMELKHQDDLKTWLQEEHGWVPTFWNVKKDSKGKAVRDEKTKDVIYTSPKLQEMGKLCPNLEMLEGDLAKDVVRFLSLRNRLSVLEGWLSVWRLGWDGRLNPKSTKITNTHRQAHSEICNVPRVGSVYGEEFRRLFCAEEGFVIAASDSSGLEQRITGHYCVPMSAQALTRTGWKFFNELIIGEDILAYNPETKKKEWTPLESKHKFSDAETYTISNSHFSVRATANHRWFVKYRNTQKRTYEDRVVETKDLNTCCNIIVNAPTLDYSGCDMQFAKGKYSIDWTERVCQQSLAETQRWLEGFLVADGHFEGENAHKVCAGNLDGRWRFSQNEGKHFDAALTAAYLATDAMLTVATRDYVRCKHNTVTVNRKGFVTMQRMTVSYYGTEEVWCPKTKHGSWVMKQGNTITITGNTHKYDGGAYAQELLEGDVHSKVACSFFPEETRGFDYKAADFNKDDPKFKPWRNKAKSGGYAVLYGSSPKKLATTLGKPESEGKRLYDAFWDSNPALKALKENVERYWETKGKKKYLPAIDGRLLNTRSKHSLINIIMQSGGAIACDLACCFMDAWLGEMYIDDKGRPYYMYKGYEVKRVIYYHEHRGFAQ